MGLKIPPFSFTYSNICRLKSDQDGIEKEMEKRNEKYAKGLKSDQDGIEKCDETGRELKGEIGVKIRPRWD